MRVVSHNADRGHHDGHQDAERGQRRIDLKQVSAIYRDSYEIAYLEGRRRLARHALLFARKLGDEKLIELAEDAYRTLVTVPMRGTALRVAP